MIDTGYVALQLRDRELVVTVTTVIAPVSDIDLITQRLMQGERVCVPYNRDLIHRVTLTMQMMLGGQ